MLNYSNSTYQLQKVQKIMNELDDALYDLNIMQQRINDNWDSSEIRYVNMAIEEQRSKIVTIQSDLFRIKENIWCAIAEVEDEQKSE